MKQLTINPNNEPYYSEDFIKGFECGTQRQLEADKADIPRWIPCSERLPEEGVHVLGTFEFQSGRGCLTTERIIINGKERWSASCGLKPIAWQPLPQPWEGADDEDCH